MGHYVRELLQKHKAGIRLCSFSVCSANEFVLESLLEFGRKHDQAGVSEASIYHVNQYGGYTGMGPRDFVEFVAGIAEKAGVPKDRVILGGDHLGPNPWRQEPAAEAMAKAEVLVQEYVRAGFSKIHLDASMHLGDDGDRRVALAPKLIAERTDHLCKAAVAAYQYLLK